MPRPQGACLPDSTVLVQCMGPRARAKARAYARAHERVCVRLEVGRGNM